MTETAIGQLRTAIKRAHGGLPYRDCNIGFSSIGDKLLRTISYMFLANGVWRTVKMSWDVILLIKQSRRAKGEGKRTHLARAESKTNKSGTSKGRARIR
jgi:hypothetical protein